MTSCLYTQLGLEAVEMQHSKFGNLDVFANRHSQAKHSAFMDDMDDQAMALGGSFHSVQGETQEALYQRLDKISSQQQEQLLAAAVATLNTTGRSDAFLTSMHACNDGLAAGSNQDGVCFRSLFATPSPLPSLPTDLKVRVELDWGALPCPQPHLLVLTVSRSQHLDLLPLTLASLAEVEICAVVVLLLPEEVAADRSRLDKVGLYPSSSAGSWRHLIMSLCSYLKNMFST